MVLYLFVGALAMMYGIAQKQHLSFIVKDLCRTYTEESVMVYLDKAYGCTLMFGFGMMIESVIAIPSLSLAGWIFVVSGLVLGQKQKKILKIKELY